MQTIQTLSENDISEVGMNFGKSAFEEEENY